MSRYAWLLLTSVAAVFLGLGVIVVGLLQGWGSVMLAGAAMSLAGVVGGEQALKRLAP